MKVSVDISLYPLDREYIPAIDAFIAGVKSRPGVEVRCNVLTTQLFGDYDVIMELLHTEMATNWATFGPGAFTVKFLPGDLRGIAGPGKPDATA